MKIYVAMWEGETCCDGMELIGAYTSLEEAAKVIALSDGGGCGGEYIEVFEDGRNIQTIYKVGGEWKATTWH